MYLIGFHEKEVRGYGKVGGVWGCAKPDPEGDVACIFEWYLPIHQLASRAGQRDGLCVCVCVCVV